MAPAQPAAGATPDPSHIQEHSQPRARGGPPAWRPASSLVWRRSSQAAPTLAAFGALGGVLEVAGALDPLRECLRARQEAPPCPTPSTGRRPLRRGATLHEMSVKATMAEAAADGWTDETWGRHFARLSLEKAGVMLSPAHHSASYRWVAG